MIRIATGLAMAALLIAGCSQKAAAPAADGGKPAASANANLPPFKIDFEIKDVMDHVIAQDAQRFTGAMVKADLEPTLQLNGVEMVNALSKRYEDDVDLASAAAELGLTKDEFAKAVVDASGSLRPLLRRLQQGVVPRDQFELRFRELAQDLTDQRAVAVAAADNTVKPQKLLAIKSPSC